MKTYVVLLQVSNLEVLWRGPDNWSIYVLITFTFHDIASPFFCRRRIVGGVFELLTPTFSVLALT